jgi:hypothetical protein
MGPSKRSIRIAVALTAAALGVTAATATPAGAVTPQCEAKAAWSYGMANWYTVFGPYMPGWGSGLLAEMYSHDGDMALMGRGC